MNKRTGAGYVAAFALAIGILGQAGPGHAKPDAPTNLAPQKCSIAAGEWIKCFSVVINLPKVPAIGETVPISFKVTSELARDEVSIEAELPGNLRWAKVPSGLSAALVKSDRRLDRGMRHQASAKRSFGKNETVTYRGSITAIAAGSAEIGVRAAVVTPGGIEAADDRVMLTVGESGRASRLGVDRKEILDTTPITLKPAVSAVPPGKQRKVDMKPAAPQGIGAQATSCVTGGWFYQDRVGTVKPSINMLVEAWDGGTRLTYGVTGWDGRYSLCFDNLASGRNVYVRFVTFNNLWRVQETGTSNNFTFGTGALYVANGATVDFGNLFPADPAFDRGLWAFDSANSAWAWKPGYCWDHLDAAAACWQLVINWSPTSTDGTYYNGQVHLASADPDAPITVVHEIGHFVMHDVYDGAYPSTPNCGPHYIHLASSAGCAWSEGFAEWFPAMVFNDPNFRWPDGSVLNLENPTWGTYGWDNGDTVEGRVAGALIDISDSANESYWDTYGEAVPGNIWHTFTNHYSNNFGEFVFQRAFDGFNVADSGALSSIYQNTIDYGFRNPLSSYAELKRPRPTPHNYGFNTTSRYWGAIAVRPASGSDYNLQLFDNRDQTTYLNGSGFGGSTVEFIAIDSLRRPLGDYYPRVIAASGSGAYNIEFAGGASILSAGSPQSVAMSTSDVVVIRDVYLSAGTPATISVLAGNAGQDAELFLIQSDSTAGSWIKSRSQALAAASATGAGGTETITITPTVSGWYGLVLINKAGSGTYTLQRS